MTKETKGWEQRFRDKFSEAIDHNTWPQLRPEIEDFIKAELTKAREDGFEQSITQRADMGVVRNQALEEAAQVAESVGNYWAPKVAQAIRSLKGNTD